MRAFRRPITAAITASLVAASVVFGAVAATASPDDRVVYTDPPEASQGPTYAHAITLRHNGTKNGTVLGTFERFLATDNGKPSFPIYRSADFGKSWNFVTNINDTQFGKGNRYQPSLYELPSASGNLAAGTILLAGSSIPNDLSSTRLVLYKSTDAGTTWTFVSTIDTGGPAIYDPGPDSTTTAIWEPEIQLTASGITVYYSDERQKSRGVLQGLIERTSSDGGRTWGAIQNVVAVPDRNSRPGMMSVDKLPNGKYFGVYEVVNGPGGGVPVYGRYSDDGVNWGDPTQLGMKLQTAAGQYMNGSPSVTWVPTGGTNGTLIVTGGGLTGVNPVHSNFLANTNLGQGNWSLLPAPIDNTTNGYAETTTASLDYKSLMEFTTVPASSGKGSVVSGVMPLGAARYEAEAQSLSSDVQVLDRSAASGDKEVGYINQANSSVAFNAVTASAAATYTIRVRYSNGTGANASHRVSINGAAPITVTYAPTRDWDAYDYVTFPATLKQGTNTITFAKGDGFAELDVVEQYR